MADSTYRGGSRKPIGPWGQEGSNGEGPYSQDKDPKGEARWQALQAFREKHGRYPRDGEKWEEA